MRPYESNLIRINRANGGRFYWWKRVSGIGIGFGISGLVSGYRDWFRDNRNWFWVSISVSGFGISLGIRVRFRFVYPESRNFRKSPKRFRAPCLADINCLRIFLFAKDIGFGSDIKIIPIIRTIKATD